MSSVEFDSRPIIPHTGYAELPNPRGGTTQVRILGANENMVYVHEEHVDKLLLKEANAIPYLKGPKDDSPEIPGQFQVSRSHAKNIWMLNPQS